MIVINVFFTIGKGNSCNGIDDMRSTYSINYEIIGDISGVCGSTTSAISYSFTDIQPIYNAVSYYKLNLGGLDFSEVKSITKISAENGFLLSNHHFTNKGVIYFSNATNELFELPFIPLKDSCCNTTVLK